MHCNFVIESICIHLHVANLDRDNNILGQDVALQVLLQNSGVYLNKPTNINTC